MSFVKHYKLFLSKIRPLPIVHKGNHIHRWVSPTLKVLKSIERKQGGKVTNPRNTYLEWNLEAELYAFSKRLNEEFNSDLLLQAFTDRSYVIKEEMKQKELQIDLVMKDNRDLAKDGEKFMKEYIQLYIQEVLPKVPPEGVKGILSYLTSQSMLAHISKNLGTKDIILATNYPVEDDILATTFKALVGALMRSSGEERAAHFVRDFVITQLHGHDVNECWEIEDPWSELKTYLGQDGDKMEARLIGEVGRNTLLACYRVAIYVDKKFLSAGFGEDVATAKEMAAREALKQIFGTQDHMKPINFQINGIPQRSQQQKRISN